MNFECKLCHTDYSTNNDAVKHYKISHNSEDGIQIDCTVKNSTCGRSFKSFQGLKKHVQKCLSEREAVPLLVSESSSNARRQTLIMNENVELSPTNNVENQLGFVFEGDDEMNCENENEPGHVYEEDLGINCGPDDAATVNTDFVFGSDDINSAAPYEISRNFLVTLLKLNLTEQNMNAILLSTEKMLEQTQKLCKQSIDSGETSASEAVDYSFDVILNDIKQLDSSHMRKKFIAAQKSFIKPSEVMIGTHWVHKRDPVSHIQMPVRKQSDCN